jgi:hypothetical protein
MAWGEQPKTRTDFVWAWETSTSVTEVSVRMQRLGHFEFGLDLVLEYAKALRACGVNLKTADQSNLPSLTGLSLAETAEDLSRAMGHLKGLEELFRDQTTSPELVVVQATAGDWARYLDPAEYDHPPEMSKQEWDAYLFRSGF